MFQFTLLAIVAFASIQFVSTQRYRPEDDAYGKPMPYNFQYNTLDEYGTQLTRTETADGSGAVRGSYSYRDADGLYRVVDYIADANGYRASVRTNEPGTAKDHSGDPADTTWEIEQPPANVVNKWADRNYTPRTRSYAPVAAVDGSRYDRGYYADGRNRRY